MVPDCGSTDGSYYECVLDLMVENMGRSNFGKPHEFDQKKGIWEGPILLDGIALTDWEIIPLEFKGEWIAKYALHIKLNKAHLIEHHRLLDHHSSSLFSLQNWKKYNQSDNSGVYSPKLFKGTLYVDPAADLVETSVHENDGCNFCPRITHPRDTYFDFSCGILEHCPWLHGSLFVNNFNVGRYHKVGPQQTLYIPGPLLHPGENEVR